MVAALAAVALMTSACTTQSTLPSASPNPSSPPSALPPVGGIAAVAGDIQPTGALPPAKVFGGDCGELLAKADIAHIAGRSLTSIPEEESDPNAEPFERFGSITCGWNRDSVSISLKALWDDPSLSIPAEACGRFISGEGTIQSDYCLFDAVQGGVRIGGIVSAKSRQAAKVISERLIQRFRDSNAVGAGTAPAADSTAWPVLYSCEKLGPIDAGDSTLALQADVIGTDGSFLPVELAVLGSPPARSCYANTGTGNVSFITTGGGAWRFDASITELAGAAPEAVTIDGFSHAMRSTTDNSRTYALVSGANYLQVEIAGERDDAAILTSIASKLDALT